jgi:hypothetical protein
MAPTGRLQRIDCPCCNAFGWWCWKLSWGKRSILTNASYIIRAPNHPYTVPMNTFYPTCTLTSSLHCNRELNVHSTLTFSYHICHSGCILWVHRMPDWPTRITNMLVWKHHHAGEQLPLLHLFTPPFEREWGDATRTHTRRMSSVSVAIWHWG